MEPYHGCLWCGASLEGKPGTRGPRQFCNKSCAQSYRNRLRVERVAPPPEPEPGVKFVPLTRGEFAKVDEADFTDVSRWNWCVSAPPKSHTKYAMRGRTDDERASSGLRAPIMLHRYLMGEPDTEIDHANGNGLDCRRANLRVAAHVENMHNSRSRAGTSRFKGVSRSGKAWRVVMRMHYKTIFIGKFANEEEAARAYDEAARRMHGAFACLNFPRDGERSALHD